MKTMLSAAVALVVLAAAAAPVAAADTAILSGPLAGNDASDLAFFQTHLGGAFNVGSVSRIGDGGDQFWVATAGNAHFWYDGAGYDNGFGVISPAVNGGSYLELVRPDLGVLAGDLNLNGSSQYGFKFAILANQGGGGGTLYTSKNSDNIDGEDHMVTWKVTSGLLTGSYIVGFEDLSMPVDGWNDHDYEDGILLVSGAAPVPEPGTMVLLGTGVMGLLAYRRRKAIKA